MRNLAPADPPRPRKLFDSMSNYVALFIRRSKGVKRCRDWRKSLHGFAALIQHSAETGPCSKGNLGLKME